MDVSSTSSIRRHYALLALLLGSAGLVWTMLVMIGVTQAMDGAILDWVSLWRSDIPRLLWSAERITRLGDGVARLMLALPVVTFLALQRRWRQMGLLIALMIGGMLCSDVLKAVIDRPRPDALLRLDAIHNASYPSGHAMGAVVLGLSLALIVRSRLMWAAALLYILLVSASRIILGVHWPSDIVGGWLIGTCWVLAGFAVFARSAARR